MLEGLPPNNASHMLRLDCDEKRARAVADLIVETFEPTETAAAAFEVDDGPSMVRRGLFRERAGRSADPRPDRGGRRRRNGAGGALLDVAEQDWVENRSCRTGPGPRRPRAGAWRA